VPEGAASGPVQVVRDGVPSAGKDFQVAPRLIQFQTELRTGIFDSLHSRYACDACHTGGDFTSGGLDLTSYEALMLGNSDHGPVVKPRNSAESLIWLKVSMVQPPVGDRMPLGGQLPDSLILKIADWIDQGARNN
jgi:hypothetical protein